MYGVLIISLLLIIVFHEWGHFIVARRFGVAIERFSIGFGPSLLSWNSKKHLTTFQFCPVLLGGYVKFADKSFDKHLCFYQLGRIKKILILLAGPLANLLLAFFLLIFVAKTNSYEPKAIIGKIHPQAMIAQQGIVDQSRVIRINDTPIETWSELWPLLHANQQNTLLVETPGKMRSTIVIPPIPHSAQFFKILGFEPSIFKVPAIVGGFTKNSAAQRQGILIGDQILQINHQPVQDISHLAMLIKTSVGPIVDLELLRRQQKIHLMMNLPDKTLGITSLSLQHYPQWFKLQKHSWREAIAQGAQITVQIIGLQFYSWSKIQAVLQQISGPVGIVRTAQHAWALSLKTYLFFLASLSIGVGVLNLLPIPLLDGGQMVFLILGYFFPNFEKDTVKGFLTIMGLLAILSLTVLGFIHDRTLL